MGILRVYLALCVLTAHSSSLLPCPMLNGRQAVQVFYLISGFYMQLILSQRYDKTFQFYRSRLIRVAVPYFVVLAIVVAISFIVGCLSGNYLSLTPYQTMQANNGALGVLFAAISNVTLFGQDIVMFLKHDLGEPLCLTHCFRNSPTPLYRYLLIPQCWTIAVELTFYWFAPWLAKRKTAFLTAIVVLSLLARITAYELFGLNQDPFNYRFFPFELAIFVSGMLSFRLYETLNLRLNWSLDTDSRKGAKRSILAAIAGTILLGTVAATLTKGLGLVIGKEYAELISYAGWALVVVGLFHLFRSSEWDRKIGELSYPIYLLHFFVIELVTTFASQFAGQPVHISWLAAFITVGSSIAMCRWIIQPLDRFRHLLSQPRSADPMQACLA
ncbi:acyltransferase family protein [Rhodopirellula sp. MGV]|uniref:acyltransferase family protein n=1 Tax=Rhodopirellula sp. MGV TaxID=2023130 RepID=UPI001304475C|nr:acyltransferase [Rhodopirellula sp. MGV]